MSGVTVRERPLRQTRMLLCFILVAAAAVSPASPQEHLPSRSKPPRPGERPPALPLYGEHLGARAQSDADRQFDRIVDEFLLLYSRMEPVRATEAGLHDYDALLPATDRAGIERSISDLDSVLTRLTQLDADRLGRERRFDHALLTSWLRGKLLDLRTIQNWKRDPSFYLAVAARSIQALLEHEYAPLDDRGWNVVARLTEIPRLLRDARANLESPPRPCTEIAIGRAAQLERYLAKDLSVQMAAIRDPVLREEYEHHLPQAADAAGEFHDWLEADLLSHSNSDVSLGPDVYAKKLLYDEMIDTPLDSLFRRAEAALRETQLRMEAEANAIGSGISVREALARLARETPPARGLVPATEAGLAAIRRFLSSHEILTLPEHENLQVAETPVYLRPLSFNSLHSPGVLEPWRGPARFYVTPPDYDWPAARQAEYLRFYNLVQLELISIHEVLGHHYQSLALEHCSSLIRALFGSRSSSEGWASYCEEMMIEEGYAAGDPRQRLAQLDRSLQGICDWLVGLALHARGATYEDAVSLYEREGYMARAEAEGRARRMAVDPSGSVGVLGKWGILDLRERVRGEQPASFLLKEFHDRLLTYGHAPIALVRGDWLDSE